VDLAKRKLGFVLAATIIGTPQSTRQTESAHASAIGFGVCARQPRTAFHPSWVARHGHRD
jgi:hypothetical protein